MKIIFEKQADAKAFELKCRIEYQDRHPKETVIQWMPVEPVYDDAGIIIGWSVEADERVSRTVIEELLSRQTAQQKEISVHAEKILEQDAKIAKLKTTGAKT